MNSVTPQHVRELAAGILSGKLEVTAEPFCRPEARDSMEGVFLFYAGDWHLWIDFEDDDWTFVFGISPGRHWFEASSFYTSNQIYPFDDMPDGARAEMLRIFRDCDDNPIRYDVETDGDTITVDHGPGYGVTRITQGPDGMTTEVKFIGVPKSCRDKVLQWISRSIDATFPHPLGFDS